MIWISTNLTEKYAMDISGFYKIRYFQDGVTFFEFKCDWDRYEDNHKPSFDFIFTLLNFKIFELNIYNINHHEEQPKKILLLD